ncbi:MAG TPA: Ig-like domain-containing protein [Gemmatimonadaceae bacterium]|nr:Ig-like domain-containing protein [Gemmatimonadaceae bacterium]
MVVPFVLGATLLLQQAAPAQQQAPAPPSPIARIVVTPTQRTMTVNDTLRLSARAVDASGQEVPGARISYTRGPGGAFFEASIDSTGLVRSGATGTLPVAVIAMVPGSRPVVERVDIRMVPGPAARIEVTPGAARLVAGQRLRLAGRVYSRDGDARDDRLGWRSSAPAVATVSPAGVVTAVAPGRATITAAAGAATGALTVDVVANSIATIEATPATVDARTGDVVRIRVTPKTASGAAVAGLTPTWSVAPGRGEIDADGAFVGYEPGQYVVTASFGARSVDVPVTLAKRDVRRPVTVVGRLPRELFTTEEVWIHPNGNIAYLGTGSGGDRMYAIDISDPAKPVVTDSIVANTRRVNDVMTTPDGKYLVFTREGAADRKNGVVFASLEDPLHPKVISEFTEGVTAGVHSSFIYKDPKHGQHVFLTNDGTGAVHVVNIDDPAKPRQVGRWKPRDTEVGISLHDIDVQDGLLYASWWNDGLIILDVGNGIKGGTPSSPKLVSQYKYDLNAMYRDVEAAAGPGFIRGTHTAWRHKNYVFIADEVFPARGVTGAKDAAAGRAYGNLQVIDVSNVEKPRAVAWYQPEYGGVHNVWVAGDTLYMGVYNGGFRVFDVSGELRGDLRAQGREMAHLNTADMSGRVKNTAMTWGVVVNKKDGLAYVNDMYNGLWVVRLEPKSPAVP